MAKKNDWDDLEIFIKKGIHKKTIKKNKKNRKNTLLDSKNKNERAL